MSSNIIQARQHELRSQAQKTQQKIATQLKILTIVLPVASLGIVGVAYAYVLWTGQYSLIEYSTFGFVVLADSFVRNLVFVGWFAAAIFFSIEAFYFLSLLKKPQFVTLKADKDLVGATRATNEVPKRMRKQRISDWINVRLERCPGTKWWLISFAVIFAGLMVYGNIGILVYRLFYPILATGYFLMLSALACFWYGYHACSVATRFEESPADPHLNGFVQKVTAILPKKVRLNESHDIMVEFGLSERSDGSTLAEKGTAHPEYFETELRTASITIDGEKRMPLQSFSPVLTALWNCYFQNPGAQTILLLLSIVNPSKQIKKVIFTCEHTIKVDRAFSVSLQSALAIFVSSLSAISGIAAIYFKIW